MQAARHPQHATSTKNRKWLQHMVRPQPETSNNGFPNLQTGGGGGHPTKNAARDMPFSFVTLVQVTLAAQYANLFARWAHALQSGSVAPDTPSADMSQFLAQVGTGRVARLGRDEGTMCPFPRHVIVLWKDRWPHLPHAAPPRAPRLTCLRFCGGFFPPLKRGHFPVCRAVQCCGVVWFSFAWCGAVRCGAVRCGAVRCGAVRCGAVRCGAVRCGAVRCGAVRCGAVRCGAVVAAASLLPCDQNRIRLLAVQPTTREI